MRKTILCLLVIMLLAALASCRVTTEEQFCPTDTQLRGTDENPPSQTPDPVAPKNDDGAQASFIYIDMYWGNYYYLGKTVTDEHHKIVTDAVMDHMLSSAAWPGVDVEAQDMYIHIFVKSADGENADYYVFNRDGKPCMQAGKDGMYSIIRNEVYRPLYELAMGWYMPHTMTVVSGGKSIYAVSNWIWSESNCISVDGIQLTPQQAEPMVEYITYAADFAPYIDGELKPDIRFKLFDDNYDEVEYIPSGREAWAEIGKAGPGKYIAVAEYSFKNEDGSSGYQYFFGLIVPEER